MQAMAADTVHQRLEVAIAELVAEPLDQRADAALGEDLIRIRRDVDRLEAEFIRRLHRFHERKAAFGAGMDTVSWVRHNCRVTARHAAHQVHLAKALGRLPASLDSARAGRSSLCNTRMIARLADDVGTEVVAPVEQVLVNAAETLDPAAMYRLVCEARLRLDPDGALDDANRAHDRRWFACDETYGGTYVLRGELDTEGGVLVKTALEALMPVPARDDNRCASQRCADALIELSRRELQSGDHRDIHGQRPHLMLTASESALRRDCDGDLPELAKVGAVHPETARRIACDASRTDVIAAPSEVATIGAVRPLSAGRSRRTIPVKLRTALRMRDRGCVFPGCDRPPEWTDAHHIRHWADGGETALNNLVLVCRRHHRAVHEEGWRMGIVDGVVHVEAPPDG